MKKTIAIALSFCLLITSLFITPLVSAESTYARYAYDFSSSIPENSSIGVNITSESGSFSADVDSTSGVLKLKAVNPDTSVRNVVYRITKLTGLKTNTKYHISFAYSIEGNSGSIVQLVAAVATSTGATQSVQTPTTTLGITPVTTTKSADLAVNTSLTLSGEMTSHSENKPTLFYIGYRVAAGETVTLNIDEITVSEVIDDNGGITASASNADMGSASVTNTNASYTDFAAGETALFTAKANDGYEFVNWTDAEGNVVSTKTSHQISSLSVDTALTANFAAANYLRVVYDYEGTTFDPEVFDSTKRYTNLHIGTANSSADAIAGTSYQIQQENTEKSGVRRGYLAEDATYLLKAGNTYHITLSVKALERSNSNIGVYLATITGEPKSTITNNVVLDDTGADTVFYIYSDNEMTVQKNITPQKDGYLAYYLTSKVDFTILFDNIIISEVLDDAEGNPLVSATSADATMGTATVTNADDNFTTFARGETAVYTATPKAGYVFDYWMDEAGNIVSAQPTYSVVLDANGTNAKALTAHFTADKDTYTTMTGNYIDADTAINSTPLTAGTKYRVTVTTSAAASELVLTGGTDLAADGFTDLANGSAAATVLATGETLTLSGANAGDAITVSEIIPLAKIQASVNNAELGTAKIENTVTAFNADAYYNLGVQFAVGESAIFTATPAENIQFSNWKDASNATVSTDNPYTVLLDASLSAKTVLTAQFKRTALDTDLNEGDTDATIKVLGIGNSYTNNATELLPELATADGIDLRIGKAIIGGSPLQTHYNNSKTDDTAYSFGYTAKGATTFTTIADVSLDQALSVTDWDYITIQQASIRSADDYDAHYAPYASALVDYIKERQPDAEILIHQTWAYSADRAPARTTGIQEGGLSQAEMFARLQANYKQLSEDLGNLRIIPTGTAWQIVRDGKLLDAESKYGSDILHMDEYSHANYLGKLLGAYAYYEAVTGIDATKSAYQPKTAGTSYFTTTVSDETTTTTFDLTAGMISALQTASQQATALYTADGFGTSDSTDSNRTTVQMRKATSGKDEALRFKFTIDRSVIADTVAGYELVEYGSLVTLNSNITDDWKPYWFAGTEQSATVTQNGKKVAIGRAYTTDGFNSLWSKSDDTIVFTAALTGIGDLGDGTMDYSRWNAQFYVIPYAVYKNAAGVTTVKYGRSSDFPYSMFDMVQSIITATPSDTLTAEQIAEDQAYLNEKFAAAPALQEAWKNYTCTFADGTAGVDADGKPTWTPADAEQGV